MTAPDGKLKVFISWSMPLSHDVAKILRDWLPRVIQDVEPWVSSEDIEKGTYWTEGIVQSLDAAKVGIIVVTPQNHERTWLNFEAGALARSIKASGGMVTPLLIDLNTASIQGPMTTLQITNFNQEDVSKLLAAVNDRTRSPVKPEVLKDQVDVWWPKLASSVSAVIKKHGAPKARSLTDREILEELLTGVRELRRTAPVQPSLGDGPDEISGIPLDRISEVAERYGINGLTFQLPEIAGTLRKHKVGVSSEWDPESFNAAQADLLKEGIIVHFVRADGSITLPSKYSNSD